MEHPEGYEVKAVDATRDYLVYLLHKGAWCQARQVGQALEILVNITNRGELGTQAEMVRPTRRTASEMVAGGMKNPVER